MHVETKYSKFARSKLIHVATRAKFCF